jgi:caa(3)-type oxidase subunit IV
MSDSHAAVADDSGRADHGLNLHSEGHVPHDDKFYIKIWGILLVLLIVSVLGPELGIRWLTLATAFGIAFVKAYLVIKNFMHLNIEKRWVIWLFMLMLSFMLVMVGGMSPDVLKHDGQNWENTAAKKVVEKGMADIAAHGTGHGEAPHGEAPHGEAAPH